MLQLLEDALRSPSGSFAFIFGILLLAFWAVYHISKWSTKLKFVDKVEGHVDIIKQDITTIKAFIEIYRSQNNPFARSQSPVTLTEMGKEVADELQIETLVSKHWNEIEKRLKALLNEDCNPYDIQQEAINVGADMAEYLSKSELDKLKHYAYQKGHNLGSYDMLLAVYIRDAYFRQHHIMLEEVDKHDPNKK